MLRLRFIPGLSLGLALGVPAGALIALLVFPQRPAEQNATTSLQAQELSHRLDLANEDKQRMNRQLEQFGKLADQMTASFNSLEQRFKALEEEQRVRDVRAAQPAPPPAPPQPAPALVVAPPVVAAPQPAAADDAAPPTPRAEPQ